MKVLVPNIGSTSFKYRLLEMPEGKVLAEGRAERVGASGDVAADYRSAIEAAIRSLVGAGKALSSLSDLGAVGFKTVHGKGVGGVRLVDDDLLEAMEAYAFLLPAHNPPYVAAMRAFREAAPGVPLVAVFETDFFPDMPEAASAYAIPSGLAKELGLRRFGFHGASHRFVSERALALCPKKGLRHVSCHLGGSSSLAAIRGGRAVDTSFGMTPQSGIPQNNRVGDIDVFAVLYAMKEKGWSIEETADVLGQSSGLAGLSGLSGDVRDLEEAASRGHEGARLALDAFVYAVRRHLGAFLLGLGGLDILTFSGGIGEKSAGIRRSVLAGLEDLGIAPDDERNAAASGETRISKEGSPVEIWVVPTNEEFIVARAAARAAGPRNRDAAAFRGRAS
jgi:acetate kinase